MKIVYRSREIINEVNGVVRRVPYRLLNVSELPKGTKLYGIDGEPIIMHPDRKILVEI